MLQENRFCFRSWILCTELGDSIARVMAINEDEKKTNFEKNV